MNLKEILKAKEDGQIDGITIVFMSLDIIQTEIQKLIESKREELKKVKEESLKDTDNFDMENFMKTLALVADAEGTKMAMDTISQTIAAFMYALVNDVDLIKLSKIVKDVGDKYSADTVMEELEKESGDAFNEIATAMRTEFNLTEDNCPSSIVRGVASWVAHYLLGTKEVDSDDIPSEGSSEKCDA